MVTIAFKSVYRWPTVFLNMEVSTSEVDEPMVDAAVGIGKIKPAH